ncbi:hypothetical protein M2G69_04320 [Vibrio vulnificus]|nr:hypothetical protein [Vibrio vulnificus]
MENVCLLDAICEYASSKGVEVLWARPPFSDGVIEHFTIDDYEVGVVDIELLEDNTIRTTPMIDHSTTMFNSLSQIGDLVWV